MEWKEYQKLAFVTNAKLGDPRLDKIHMILGMSTELGEFQDVFKKHLAYKKEIDWRNVKEEIGDTLWYVAGLAEHEGYAITSLFFDIELAKEYSGDNYTILVNLSSTLGLLSMNAFSGNGDIRYELQNFVNLLFAFCSKNNIDFWRVIENNIEKLQARYPEKFNAYDATHRNLDEEKLVLDE
ncbi:MAG: hypothetical protein KAR20_01995 [Candidatus Heimdallarchaeota archaeon]|nr:hypothetical protein [Candidatus Heimdallarchaeota archaeon]